MADTAKVPVKTDKSAASTPQALRPFESLRREVDRLFDDFAGGVWRSPFGRSFFDIEPAWRTQSVMTAMPAVDVTETDKAYEIIAELPGMDEKNIEVKVADDVLTIKGEKREEKEEKNKNYYLSERSFWFVPALLSGAEWCGCRQDRRELQEWCPHGDLAQERGGAKGGKEDHSKSSIGPIC